MRFFRKKPYDRIYRDQIIDNNFDLWYESLEQAWRLDKKKFRKNFPNIEDRADFDGLMVRLVGMEEDIRDYLDSDNFLNLDEMKLNEIIDYLKKPLAERSSK